jgi:pSer/pThr/pTyr-binding forkhead associated (FHA) protein
MIRLTLRQDEGRINVQEFSKEDILVGRSEEADVRLDNESVSRRHARIIKKPEGWKVADLGAPNGVFLQRGGVPPAIRIIVEDIRSGDVVCIEKYKITFEMVEGDALRADVPADVNDRPNFGPEGFTRVTTLPKFLKPDLSNVKTEPPKVDTSGAHLDALMALSGATVSRLSRHDAPTTTHKPVLDILEPNAGKARRIVMGNAPVQFGSDVQCDVRITGLTVPRYLATVELSGEKAILRRVSTGLLGPKVTVEGRQVKVAELDTGQSAQVGPVRITFLLG